MADYNNLKASIANVIKTNNRNEITGQILQNVLNQMVGVIGENYQLAGFANPLTNPGAPDQNIFYVADQGGTYTNFDNIVLDGGVSFLMWKNSRWSSHTINVVTSEWVSQNFVSIEYFRSLFRAYDEYGAEIMPNNEPDPISGDQVVVDSIKSMVGLWTQYYLSALGQGSGGGGGGGASALADLVDVQLTSPITSGQALLYNSTLGKWVNGTVQAGVDMNTVWSELAGSGTEQINISHLTGALADYATQTWVSNNFITVAYFDRLFRAYNGSTLVNHNDTTSTIDNIKAMFGFWTQQYLSSLGQGTGSTVALGLSELLDVQLTTPVTNGQALVYNSTSLKWENQNISTVTTLADLTDVLLTSPAANQVLVYDGTQWVNSSVKTVNGYSILGTGDIPASGGGGAYLPLAGGTMTGYIVSQRIRPETDNYSLYTLGTSSYQYYVVYAGYVNSGNGHWLDIASNNGSGDIFIDTSHNIGFGTKTPSMPFHSAVNSYFAKGAKIGRVCIETDANGEYNSAYVAEINAYYNSLYLQYRSDRDTILSFGGGNVGIKTKTTDSALTVNGAAHILSGTKFNNICIECDNSIANTSARASEINCYNGGLFLQHNTNNKLVVCSGGGNMGVGTLTPSYKLHVNGTIYATGEITALSDIKQKNIKECMQLGVDEVANAPIIKFTWKEQTKDNKGLHVGSIAQYWEKVLPEAVKKDKEGTLSMSYGVVALVAAVSTAKKVQEHERRIAELERENKELKERLKIA